MGSVGPNYVCPHCDGKGYGGYSPDSVGYPICVDGKANCLEKAIWGAVTRQEVQMHKYEKLFAKALHPNQIQEEVLAGQPDLLIRVMEFM